MKRTAAVVALFLLGSTVSAQEWTEEAIDLSSAHPYGVSPAGSTVLVHRPGAEAIRIYFERIEIEQGWDVLELNDARGRTIQRLTGAADHFWSEPVRGDEISLRLVTDRTGSGYGFRATRLSILRHGHSAILRLQLTHAGRVLGPGDRITIEAGGSLDLFYQGILADGHPTVRFGFDPRAETPEGPAPITIETLADGQIHIHATGNPVADRALRIRDALRPHLATKFRLTILAFHPHPLPPPPIPQPRWIQIGQTQVLPPYARSHQDMDLYFVASAGATGFDQVKILTRGPVQIREIRIDFRDGTRLVIFQGSHPLMTGEELPAGIPAAYRAREIQRIRVRLRGRGDTQLLAHARHPG